MMKLLFLLSIVVLLVHANNNASTTTVTTPADEQTTSGTEHSPSASTTSSTSNTSNTSNSNTDTSNGTTAGVSGAVTSTVAPSTHSTGASGTTPGSATGFHSGAGCVVNGTKVGPGDRVRLGGFVFECQVSATQIRTSIVACLQEQSDQNETAIVHEIGGRWEEGEQPFRFVFECTKEERFTVRRVVQCHYYGKTDQAKLEPGCVRRVGSDLVQCSQRGDNGLQYSVFYNASDAQQTKALSDGQHRLC